MSSIAMSTSRVGRMPVTVPSGVQTTINGKELQISGPKGKSTLAIHPLVELVVENNTITVQENKDKGYTRSGSGAKLGKSITGTTRAKIANIIHGVTHLFERKLLLVGVGYKAQSKGKFLGLTLGFSHPIDFPIPEGIVVETPIPTEIIVKGIDKDLVGLVASQIRAFRGPEPYKGKGVRYADEVIVRKETKKK